MRSLMQGFAAIVALATASSALAGAPVSEKGELGLAKLLQGRTAGPAVRCIDPARAFSTEVFDGTAVVYRMPGGKLYVNRPSLGADMLDQDNMLRSRTFGGRLCQADGVSLIDRGKFPTTVGMVRLGAFVPYSKAER